MTDVWVSRVLSNHVLGRKPGFVPKFFEHDWPDLSSVQPVSSPEMIDAMEQHIKGVKLERQDFPEACCVFDEKRFKRVRDLFFVQGFTAVKGKLADLLPHFDLGEGGELVPFTIYNDDKITPKEGPFFFLNYAARKDTLVPEQTQKIREFYRIKADGVMLWKNEFEWADGDVVVTEEALNGADLWFEKQLHMSLFVSDRLAKAITQAKLNFDFGLLRCEVVDLRG